jgi:hypothetical protein
VPHRPRPGHLGPVRPIARRWLPHDCLRGDKGARARRASRYFFRRPPALAKANGARRFPVLRGRDCFSPEAITAHRVPSADHPRPLARLIANRGSPDEHHDRAHLSATSQLAQSPAGRAVISRLLLVQAPCFFRPPATATPFESALVPYPGRSPLHQARTELLDGEWLRRERQRREARRHVRRAADLFRQVGAAPWQERAEAELRATGETARGRDPSMLGQLTPQELQIAGLVASGMTNRESRHSCSSARARSTSTCAESSAKAAWPPGPSSSRWACNGMRPSDPRVLARA